MKLKKIEKKELKKILKIKNMKLKKIEKKELKKILKIKKE
jgi:hypothetical protein